MKDWLADRPRIEKIIAGALADAIHAHGPIDLDNHASAAKRVYGQLKGHRRQFLNKPKDEE